MRGFWRAKRRNLMPICFLKRFQLQPSPCHPAHCLCQLPVLEACCRYQHSYPSAGSNGVSFASLIQL